MVAREIPTEFLCPKRTVGLRGGAAPTPLVAVPEATVHEDGDAMLGKDNIRSAGEIARMQAETKSRLVQCAPYRFLWPGVGTPDRRHHSGTRCPIHAFYDLSRFANSSHQQDTIA